jgi:gas vesicle protein
MTGNENYQRYDSSGESMRWMVAGFGLGLLIGGAIGLLLAPKAGHETRGIIRDFATDFHEKARVVTGDIHQAVKTAATTYTEQATGTIGQVTEKAKVVATGVGEKTRKVSGKITEGISTLKEAGTKFSEAVREGYKKKMTELDTPGCEVSPDTDGKADVEIEAP